MTSLSCAVPPMLPPMAWDYCRVYWKATFLDISEVVKLVGETVTDVIDQHRHGDEMVDGAIEEALGLRRVQVDAHDAVGACGFE